MSKEYNTSREVCTVFSNKKIAIVVDCMYKELAEASALALSLADNGANLATQSDLGKNEVTARVMRHILHALSLIDHAHSIALEENGEKDLLDILYAEVFWMLEYKSRVELMRKKDWFFRNATSPAGSRCRVIHEYRTVYESPEIPSVDSNMWIDTSVSSQELDLAIALNKYFFTIPDSIDARSAALDVALKCIPLEYKDQALNWVKKAFIPS